MKRFEYIGCHYTDNKPEISEFTLFANIVSRTDTTVTFNRYMKFGTLPWGKPVTISNISDPGFYTLPVIIQRSMPVPTQHQSSIMTNNRLTIRAMAKMPWLDNYS